MWRMCWRRCARRGWPERRQSHSRGVEAFRRSSIAWSMWPPINGVEFYNDSKATNVDATAKAIAAFSGGIHLILGGKDKNSDYTQLAQRCCGRGCARSTPSARRRPRSSRNCAAWFR
jgi:hypothetical protein